MDASDLNEDEDYFTPLKSTPLANIFNDNMSHQEENPSLKYFPPKQEKEIDKVEQPKSPQCLYSSTLLAYEWNDNGTYATRKVGVAVVNIAKKNTINLLLYDSNKVTLSCTTIQSESEFKVKDNVYISFFDDSKKYWNVSGSINDMRNLLEILKSLSVQLKPCPKEVESENSVPCSPHSNVFPTNTATDTDSSDDRKIKASILNRMASMGHPILPTVTCRSMVSSDTSDTNEEDTHKAIKHRHIKNIFKRKDEHATLRNDAILRTQPTHDSNPGTITDKNNTVSMVINKSVVPLNKHTITTDMDVNRDLNLLMAEQRVNSSEVRLNVGRLTEKVDKILDKLNEGSKSEGNKFENKVYEKLLTEYENKIKNYEEFIKSKGLVLNNICMQPDDMPEKHDTNTLVTLSQQKDVELSQLSATNSATTDLVLELDKLKQLLKEKDKEIVMNRNEIKQQDGKCELDSKLKAIMNATYSLLETQFEDANYYTGRDIKSVLANVIRKVTIDSLNSTRAAP